MYWTNNHDGMLTACENSRPSSLPVASRVSREANATRGGKQRQTAHFRRLMKLNDNMVRANVTALRSEDDIATMVISHRWTKKPRGIDLKRACRVQVKIHRFSTSG